MKKKPYMRKIDIEGSYSEEFRDKQRLKAIERIKTSDSFVLISKLGTDNNCVSAIDGDHKILMAANCDLFLRQLTNSINEELS